MQAALMTSRRFAPLFWTQFFGAFNDNLFKNAVVILIVFRAVHVAGIAPEQMVALSGAIFIAPYLLFSGIAGQVADKLDKARLIRAAKLAEIAIMAVGALGFVTGSVPLLLAVLFLMGTQSTVFGPCKYGILPQHLGEAELVAGNALVEMGTYLAILLGTLAGALAMDLPGGERVVAGGVLAVALIGAVTSLAVPAAPSSRPDLPVGLDPVRPTLELIRLCRKKESVWLSILGISWFWAYGAVLLALFPTWTKDVLGGGESLTGLFLALFSIGIGAGSMLCEKLSRERLELGLVPLGALGTSLFTLDLSLIGTPWPTPAEPIGVVALLSTFAGWRITVDLTLLSVFGGFMIVPLYTLVQWRTDRSETSRVIAGNNVVNAVFIVVALAGLAGLYAAGLSPIHVFAVLAAVNIAVAAYMYTVVPEFVLRFVVWMLANVVYRVRVSGQAQVPVDGPAVLVANHVSFIDWFVISAAIKRPARFVMHHSFYNLPVMRFLFRQAKVIPIASSKEDPALLAAAMERIHAELQDEQLVCIFPEGKITETGEVAPFRQGIERIVARDPVPVIPVALDGLWGSFFSRHGGSAMRRPFRRWWSRVTVRVGAPVPPERVTAPALQERVCALLEPGTSA
jgi:1-acyl-sn-glycerol-3-phosphate acyltransferase